MSFSPIVVGSLRDQFLYLDYWYGRGQWQIIGRRLAYQHGRTYDLLDVFSQGKQYQVPFDSTAIRPVSPAGETSSKWAVLAILGIMVVGVVALVKSKD